MGCMLFFAKGMARMQQQQRERVYKKFLIEELFGKTVVLIGVGELGGAVARRSKAFGMRTIGVRRRPGRDGVDPAIDDVVEMDAMAEALGRADYVVSSLPLTDRTRGVLDERFFRFLKASLIETAQPVSRSWQFVRQYSRVFRSNQLVYEMSFNKQHKRRND